MTTTLPNTATVDLFHPDRPGWIPEHIADNWDPHPYAYQTREELMPAGYLHGIYLHTLLAMLKPVLARLGLRLFIDVFIFYRDWEGRKQRVAPDAVIAPGLAEITDESLHKYDLDTEPVPLCAIEVISPRSRKIDEQSKRAFYAGLGIDEYLLLDVEDANEQPLDQIDMRLWRVQDGLQLPVAPDAEGFLTLACLGVRLRADRRRLVAEDLAIGTLLDTPELQNELAAAVAAQQQAEAVARAEAAARQQLEAELAQLREELARRTGGRKKRTT